MPELAEVEWYRKQWDPGLNQKVLRVATHPKARIFRGVDTTELEKTLTGAKLLSSEAKGKQMIFHFSTASVGVHLGMTGKLHVDRPDYEPKKHDHFVIYQKAHALIFTDFRLFGRVQFHPGKDVPPWWGKLPPEVLSKEFGQKEITEYLARRKAPLKAVLLMQDRFPGIGNWMADEILWRIKIHPAMKASDLSAEEAKSVWKGTREVAREAMKVIGAKWDDPPDSWLFNHRWGKNHNCPRCGVELKRKEIGGRTTCWCPHCQPG